MQANQTIEITVETTELLDQLFTGFMYSENCGFLSTYERGKAYEEYLAMRKFIKQCENQTFILTE